MTTPTAVAEALAELELCAADVACVRDVLDLVRAILDEQDGADCT
jgi:hypothetical protein